MKKFLLLTVLACSLVFSGCGGAEPAENEGDAAAEQAEQTEQSAMPEAADQSAFTWQITLKSHELLNEISSIENSVLYDGTVQETPHYDAPTEGQIFLLLSLNLNKAQAGNNPFSWDDLSVEDAQGQTYARLANDSFIENHSYSRLPSTDLALGENDGYICFEIAADAAEGALYLVHQSAEGENRLQIK